MSLPPSLPDRQLRNDRITSCLHHLLHCRIGSLENTKTIVDLKISLHCRIGSLETEPYNKVRALSLHCRIGSLETSKKCVCRRSRASLPDRQLRNVACFCLIVIGLHCRIGSLENKNAGAPRAASLHCRIGSLEKRQHLRCRLRCFTAG